MYDIDSLPQHYIADGGARIERPVYLLMADCFLGLPGGPPSYWEQGTELETALEPNEHMQPLNKAAGIRYNEWERKLPPPGSAVSPDELLHAANILRQKEGAQDLPFELWRREAYALAIEMRNMREGRRLPDAPAPRVLAPANGSPVPPMSAGDFKHMTHRDPSATGMTAHPQAGGRRVKRAPAPPMATEPPPQAGGVAA